MFTTVARFKKSAIGSSPEERAMFEKDKAHLEGLALDSGLAPELNIRVSDLSDDGVDEIRLGISEKMDVYLREAPGEWRHY